MAYILQTVDNVEAYLRNLAGISEAGRQNVVEAYLRDLAEHADDFLRRAPLAHESYLFQYEYALIDSGCLFDFRFIVDGSSMPYGVVQVLYVDCDVRPVFDVVEIQAADVTVAQARQLIARRYGITDADVRAIEEEGVQNEWPPL